MPTSALNSAIAVTLIPPHRASTQTRVEARLWSPQAARCRWTVTSGSAAVFQADIELGGDSLPTTFAQTFEEAGELELVFEFFDATGVCIERRVAPYQIVDSGVRSTRQIDGCWVSIVHWSEEEARHFNADLKRLGAEDWKEQIRAMNAAGIKSVLIQNLFHADRYAGRHTMTPQSYDGAAFYPSGLYEKRYPLACEDPVRAILEAAEQCGMTVFLGVGLFAWFDFSQASLEWHKRVTQELFERYGGYSSLYGWYVSEEMFGSLYDEWEYLPNEAYKDVASFFEKYTAFVRSLTPTKPVALAPNNIRFQEFATEWGEILPNIDILIPFAFARDPQNMNIAEIQEICDRAGTRFWVDMEMFAFPLDDGLVPKSLEELVAEIRNYDAVEQIFGYQFTGIMNPADSPFDLGGQAAKELYVSYCRFLADGRLARTPAQTS